MKYSITIPAYKSTFLKECIDSILNQTFSDFELIILNDASPEPIEEIVKQYNDTHIRYEKNEKNVGAVDVVDNWNKLLELAQGEYIICMGDDDMLAPNCLEEYNQLIDKHPGLDVYHARTMMIDEKSEFCNLQEARPEFESVYSMIWHRTFKYRIQFVGDYLYRIKNLRKNGGFYKFPLAWESDCVTSFIAASSHGIANGVLPTFFYRQNNQSITSSKQIKLKMDATIAYEKWIDLFLLNEPSDNLDKKYYSLTKAGIHFITKKHKVLMIAADKKNILFWWKNHSLYNLSTKDIFKAFCISIALIFNK